MNSAVRLQTVTRRCHQQIVCRRQNDLVVESANQVKENAVKGLYYNLRWIRKELCKLNAVHFPCNCLMHNDETCSSIKADCAI